MDLTSGDASGLVFQRITKANLGEFSLDGKMLNVLMSLDGDKDLADIAEEQGLDLATVQQLMARLVDLGLAERVEMDSPTVDQDFLDYLTNQLLEAVGPIATVLLEDVARDLGYDLANLPGNRAAELIIQLSQEIQQEERRNRFKQNMLSMIKEKGY
jgi:predicted transcriptional regulator